MVGGASFKYRLPVLRPCYFTKELPIRHDAPTAVGRIRDVEIRSNRGLVTCYLVAHRVNLPLSSK